MRFESRPRHRDFAWAGMAIILGTTWGEEEHCRRRRARLAAAIGLAAFGIASFAAASSLGDHHPVAGPRQAGAFPLGSAPSSTGDVRTHGIARPHRVPAIRTMSPGRPRWYGNKTVDELRGGSDAEGLPQALPAPSKDGALQKRTGGRAIPAPIVSFNGVGNRNGLLPPDTNGEIGPNHYLQIANVSFAVYNRDGSVAYGPANNNLLFTGTPLCGTHNQGDPLVLYDQFSERWMASQFATGPDGNYECISVSATNDPTGAWCGYEFLIHPTKFGDYPKFGVWPTQNAFVMTVNQFDGYRLGWGGGLRLRARPMLACEPARFVYKDMYDVNPNLGSFLPADADGSIAPPAGAAIPFVTVRDGAPDASACGADDRLEHAVAPGHPRPGSPRSRRSARICAGAPGTASRSRGRASASSRSPTGSCTGSPIATSAGGRRWSSTTRSTRARTARACAGTSSPTRASGWGIGQQGTFAPADGLHRWMGSVAQDSSGDMALGYSVSSSTTYPSIRYTGRLATDPPGDDAAGRGVDHRRRRLAAQRFEPLGRLLGDGRSTRTTTARSGTRPSTTRRRAAQTGAPGSARSGSRAAARRLLRRHRHLRRRRLHRRRLSTTSTTTRPAAG